MKYDVFVSYSRRDKESVMAIVEQLKANGVKVWIDADGIQSGDAFKRTIVTAIMESGMVIFFSSKDSNISKWTAKEIGIAVSEDKKIIPVKLDNSKYNLDLRFDLVNLDYLEAFALSNDIIVQKLLSSIKDIPATTVPKHSTKAEQTGENGSHQVHKEVEKQLSSIIGGLISSKKSPMLQQNRRNVSRLPVCKEIPFTVKGVNFIMVEVEGGSFQRGTNDPDVHPDDKPAHKANVCTFSIGKTEVTQSLWHAVMGSNPSHFVNDNSPVEQVSWDDCQIFIHKLNNITGKNFRLPTEAEWEYAARGGNKSRGYKYSGRNHVTKVAWFADNSNGQTHPVATKSPNELGLYDMSGNVYEWTSDFFVCYARPVYNESVRMCRGGCWGSTEGGCRISCRCDMEPSDKDKFTGLRLAL